ncbi:MAG: S1C family serine protease [Dehalococcoidia bacterium]
MSTCLSRQRLLAVSAALLLMVAVAGCTQKNRPNAAATTAAPPSAAATTESTATNQGGVGSTRAQTSAPRTQAAAATAARSTTLTTAATTTTSSDATVNVVNTLRPSVVRVHTSQSQIGAFGGVQNASGVGTGVILDTQGHILTNNHVVTLGGSQASTDIQVDLADGRQNITAKLIGREPAADLAVLQISESNLTPVKFADPASLQVGQDVVAIGYALDLGSTPSVTKGVISALDRQIDETLQNSNNPLGGGTANIVGGAIQTDAAINPGNSGGPLVNMAGEVVGINTAGIFQQNGQPVQGINFAVSVESIQPVAKALIDKGQVDRGFLGLNLQPISRDAATAQHLPVPDGVGVVQVVRGGPADQAGLKAGDIITKLGDKDIHTFGDLQQQLILNGPNTKLPIEYYRGAAKQSANITLGTRPAGQ